MGRPSKYNKEVLEKAKKYTKEYESVIPSAAGLARSLGVAKSTVYKWAEENKDFSDALGAIQTEQEFVLVEKGLTKEFDSGLTKLMLHNHGHSDKQAIDHTSGGEKITGIVRTVVDPGEKA